VGSELVLVSNTSRTRWVIPKGHFEKEDTAESLRAALEAWEEAGVQGEVESQSRGHFFYTKRGLVHRVSVFLMTNCCLLETWPEKSLRERVLVSPGQAVEMVNEPELKELLRVFDPSPPSRKGLT
jgi:8-oxo-dGTP pyrophosphatase MutT (NUDIX family)